MVFSSMPSKNDIQRFNRNINADQAPICPGPCQIGKQSKFGLTPIRKIEVIREDADWPANCFF